ncbi:hypothetical protein QFC19_008453 [Naganishia cerealis]|uniref:Uncharacterized protein n=1 Tax=Naganishia cerealis TaxID=610337 RepID=A0ACC2V1X7_9TREE|nr:hypothetical protein QFC19_008453 [Naganishia cerealis]
MCSAAQDQPQGLRRRRRSDSGEAGSEQVVDWKRAKIDQSISSSPTQKMNGNGGSNSAGGSGGGFAPGAGASLSARIRRVDFPGEWMYTEDAVKAGYTADETQEQDNGKGKGKGRALDTAETEIGDLHNERPTKPSSAESVMPVRREEFVRLVLQALREVGYNQTAEVLRAESGYEEENQTATALRNAILGGRWSESITLLEDLGVVLPGDRLPLRRNRSFGFDGGRQNDNNSNTTTPGATPTKSNPVVSGSSISNEGRLSDVPMFGSVPLSMSATNGFGQGGLTPATSFETGSLSAPELSSASTLDHTSRQGNDGASLGVSNSTSDMPVESSPEDSVGRQAIFKIYEQKYLELLELDQQNRALSVLRHQLAPIAAESDRLHALSRCLFKGKAALYEERGWDGARGNSRMKLLYHLQGTDDLVPSGIILPPKRLATLFDQARKYQQLECSYHNNEPAMSLLSDHSCKRGSFPSVPTHVLNEHTDEVWVLEWSHDGRFLATEKAPGVKYPTASRTPDQKPPPINGHEPDNLATDSEYDKMQRVLLVYDMSRPGVEKSRRVIPGEVTCMSLSPDEKQILMSFTTSVSPDDLFFVDFIQPRVRFQELQLWQFKDDALQFVRKYAGHVQRDGVLLHSCFGGNSRNYVMSASEDAHVYVWHKDSGGLLEVLEGHDAAVTDVAWNPVQPNLFASCSDDHTVRLWQPPAEEDVLLGEKWADGVRSHNGTGPASGTIGLPTVPKSPTGIDVDMIIA